MVFGIVGGRARYGKFGGEIPQRGVSLLHLT